MSENKRILLPCLCGPTGAGKSAAALALARRFPVSVINCDSRQVYRDFPIITAQPSEEERTACPHLLYGFLPTAEKLGAGEYSRLAGPVLRQELAKGRLPVLVGGTGLYFKAFFEGIAPIPPVPAPVEAYWQERLNAEGSPALHRLLAGDDPDYAAKIHPNDRQRVTRALAVRQSTGRSFSDWHTSSLPPGPYKPIMIGIGRSLAELEPLLERRIGLMLQAGALDEARAALEKCGDPAAPGWSGIGCAEARQYLEGKISLDECLSLWLKNTRAYAKRQLTWFRAVPDLLWFTPEDTRGIIDMLGGFAALAKYQNQTPGAAFE